MDLAPTVRIAVALALALAAPAAAHVERPYTGATLGDGRPRRSFMRVAGAARIYTSMRPRTGW